MPKSHKILIKKPASTLISAVSINRKEFLSSIAKSITAGLAGQTSTSIEYGIDAFKEIGAKSKPEYVAWKLVVVSFLSSFSKVAEESKSLLSKEIFENDIIDLGQRLDHLLSTTEIYIDSDFFKRPQNFNLFDEFKPALALWLTTFGMTESQTNSFQSSLRKEFIRTLNEQWSKDQTAYKCIFDAVITPFTHATDDQVAWDNYSLSLSEKTDEPVFHETFSLKSIYISPRAYYQEINPDSTNKLPTKKVCDLHETMLQWVQQFDKNNPLKIISGNPGSGKSSFAKIFSSEIIKAQLCPLLFIPLHLFNLSDDLIESIERFFKDEPHFSNNPFYKDNRPQRLVLVFDGLDEMAEQSNKGSTPAVMFIDSLTKLLDRLNDAGDSLQAVVTGREFTTQEISSHFQNNKNFLTLLPYRIKESEKSSFYDPKNLLETDQCHQWWVKLGQLKAVDYKGIPKDLNTEKLFPLTKEPLLNYLLSLHFEDQDIDFDVDTNLNKIYYQLFQTVYERNYSSKTPPISYKVCFNDFLTLLEEIAHAVWKSNGRTALEKDILKQIEKSNLSPLLSNFSKSKKNGITRLLTAFYFKELDETNSHKRTFPPVSGLLSPLNSLKLSGVNKVNNGLFHRTKRGNT